MKSEFGKAVAGIDSKTRGRIRCSVPHAAIPWIDIDSKGISECFAFAIYRVESLEPTEPIWARIERYHRGQVRMLLIDLNRRKSLTRYRQDVLDFSDLFIDDFVRVKNAK